MVRLLRRAPDARAGVRALLGGALPIEGRGAAVLAYHDVSAGRQGRGELGVSRAQLRAHLTAVLGAGMRFVPVAEILDRLDAGSSVDGLAALTFDDALDGLYRHARPVLAELQIGATVFTVSRLLGVGPPWDHSGARSLTRTELAALAADGHTIGSHTATHASLPELSDRDLHAQLRDSRAELGEIAGSDVDLLAYPYGHHDARVRAAARASGYRAAFGFVNGRLSETTPRFAIPRLCLTARHSRARLLVQLARPADRWPPDPRPAHLVTEGERRSG